MSLKPLIAVGVMTGNSLDAADSVLTRFSADGTITDLCSSSTPLPSSLQADLRDLRLAVEKHAGDTSTLSKTFRATSGDDLDAIVEGYTELLSRSIKTLLDLSKKSGALDRNQSPDIVGIHGQTLAHCPPSIAKSKDPSRVYTVQLGDGQRLADRLGLTVAYDFRSDDIINGGEGAPLAPVHHKHIASIASKEGRFPIAFCNAGNTGNITIVSIDKGTRILTVMGWDTGPFNNYPDKLARNEMGVGCDFDGKFGSKGKVNLSLLKKLFESGVVTRNGENFLIKPPPKSSDPEWYVILPELSGAKPVDGQILSFEDRIRTAEYFSAYIYFHTLSLVPEHIQIPSHFAYCGGGWNNPISREDFRGLLMGDPNLPVLPEHQELFPKIRSLMTDQTKDDGSSALKEITLDPSERYGFDGTAMEARIFADAAVCRVMGVPFSLPETTGTSKESVLGILRFPRKDEANASKNLIAWLDHFRSRTLTIDMPTVFESMWSRATAGWARKI